MMPLRFLSVRGYRSIQRLHVKLGQVNVIVGANGCGKSNLYRTLHLLTAAADGRLAATLAQDGGMPSALWAGEQYSRKPKRIAIEVCFDQWIYGLECGLRSPSDSAFDLDPMIRDEHLQLRQADRKISMCHRKNALAELRDADGNRVKFPFQLSESESILSELREPHRYPELSSLRHMLLGWRFYHHFRTDAASPLRRPQVGVRTPVLHHDGTDLAAALQTIAEMGNDALLAAAINDAFPGGRLDVSDNSNGMVVGMAMRGFRREFSASELSDGTLKYLCLLAALLSPRPPTLLGLNEPDANLHPQLFAPLAKLVATTARQSQLWITTHSTELADLLVHNANARLIRLEKDATGATIIAGMSSDEDEEEDDDEEDEDDGS